MKVHILITCAAVLLTFNGIASANQSEHQTKKNICHATASESNPWEAISVASNNHTHDNHTKDFAYTGPVKDNGQPTKDGDAWCEENQPKEEPTDVCPNIEGNQATVPESMELIDGQCLDTTPLPEDPTPPTTVDEPAPVITEGK